MYLGGGGTIQEISKMLDAHYKGDIDISDYWAVGDSRTESISEIPSVTGTLNDSYAYIDKQPAQSIELVIIGINHDKLSSAINNISDAALTIQTKECLSGLCLPNNYKYSYDIPWGSSKLRKYLNDDFLSAISTDLSNLIKPVYKDSSYYDSDSASSTLSTTKDSIFVLSEYEVFGEHKLSRYTNTDNDTTDYGPAKQDGVQYEYMKNASNRIKPDGFKNKWWMRTAFYASQSMHYYYLVVNGRTGDMESTGSASTFQGGIVPAFCL